MANRRASTLLQILTVGALGVAWLVTRATHRRETAKQSARYPIAIQRHLVFSFILFVADLYAIPAVLRGKLVIDADEFQALLPDLVPKFDRHALSFSAERREHFRHISDNVLKGLVALPFLLLVDARIRRDWKSIFTLYAWLHALTYTLYSFSPLGPAFVDKYRPVVYYTGLSETDRNLGNNRNARFSGHTANAACAAFFMAKVYNDYHPRLGIAGKFSNYLLAYCAPLLLGWLRMKSLKHFPSDVLQAIVIGGTCGVMIPELYKR